jgi:folate/biopterin transporter
MAKARGPDGDLEDHPPDLQAKTCQLELCESEPLLKKRVEPRSRIPGDYFGLVAWLSMLNAHFGHELLVMLFFVQHLLKGFVASMSIKATPFLYRSYHLPGPQIQIYGSVSQLPWSMKPIIGLLSDVMPIGGYNKAPYIVLTSLAGGVAFSLLGWMPQSILAVKALVACMFLKSLQLSTCDLLSEAKYAEKMQEAPQHGPSLMTYVWFGLALGGLVATLISGPIIHSFGPKVPFIIASVPALLVLLPVFMGYFGEKQCTPEDTARARQRMLEQGEACFLCVLMLAGTVCLSVCGLLSKDPLTNCTAAVCVACVMLIAFSVVLSPTIAKFNAFSLIQTALHLSTSGATFYFYTDTKEQYPEGPHFSEFFYASVMGTVGSVCSLLGILSYQKYMRNWRYRQLIIYANVAKACLSFLDVMMFARVNVWLGIPDKVLVLGLSTFEEILEQWQWMPQVVILAKLCPKGMEATMYALLAGCHNLGFTVGSSGGALLIDRLGVKPSGAVGESAKFELLWVAALVSAMLPLLFVFLFVRLVPDARQDERLVDEEEVSATRGSLWNKYVRGLG